MVSTARVDLPNVSDIESYRPSRVEELAQGIRRAIDSYRFDGSECVISIDNRLLRVRSIRQPAMPPEELNRALHLEAASRLGFGDHEQTQLGWVVAGEVTQGEARGQEVILVGAPRDPIERIVMGLNQVGLRTLAVEPSFQACARPFTRYIRRSSEQEDVRAIVDIGMMSTGVMLLRGRQVAFYKPLEIGGAKMSMAAAERLGLELESVRDLRNQAATGSMADGPGLDPKVDRAMFEAVRPLISELAREVALCMRYYSVTFRGSRPRECLVVGGEAATPHLVDVLRDELRIQTELGEPLRNVEPPRKGGQWDQNIGCGGEWTVAAGLGMRFWEAASLRQRFKRSKTDAWSRRSDTAMPRTDTDERRAA